MGETGSAARDAELVAKARDGDITAFADLYSIHVRGVTTAVRNNMGDADMVCDVVQEAFARAFERLNSLRDPASFRPWVLAIARHAAVDHARHRARVTLAGDTGDLDEVADHGATPDQVVEAADLFARGTAALSKRDAATVALVVLAGSSPTEIGMFLGVSVGAARVALHRARRRFGEAVPMCRPEQR